MTTKMSMDHSPKQPQFAHGNSVGEEKDNVDVKEDEKDGDAIKLDRKTALRAADGRHAGLVCGQLACRWATWPQD